MCGREQRNVFVAACSHNPEAFGRARGEPVGRRLNNTPYKCAERRAVSTRIDTSWREQGDAIHLTVAAAAWTAGLPRDDAKVTPGRSSTHFAPECRHISVPHSNTRGPTPPESPTPCLPPVPDSLAARG
ncbi:hypothetical protein QAD02_024395 [Eretmocerus hayati]|uniref:Uncharacterized protein n=1 Tax=Eretmocerus hayati TaxID=131215 RepID=A0ACC2PYA8_9HYME|nr:hypothetical protein QAD02_024395 [Eretmocerus hayati]